MRAQVFSADMVASIALFIMMMSITYYSFDAISFRQDAAREYSFLEAQACYAINQVYQNTSEQGVFNPLKLRELFNSTNVSGEYNLWSGYLLTVTDSNGNVLSVDNVTLNDTNNHPIRENSPVVYSERKGLLNGQVAVMRLKAWY